MLRLEEILGREVLSTDAKLVGTVEGIGLDTQEWKVGALKVSVAKGVEPILNVRKPMFGAARAAFPTEKVESVRDVIKMKEPLNKLAVFIIDHTQIPVNASDLINRRVVSSKGSELGVNESMFIEPEAGWKIPFLELDVDREAFRDMKLKKGAFKGREVKLPTSLVQTVGDMIMLNTHGEDLARILQHTPR